jgi:hypothetical protein
MAGSKPGGIVSATRLIGCSPTAAIPGEPVFPGLAMIGMVSGETERGYKIERETRHYLGSTKLDADTFARGVRGHWGIENGLHWVLDRKKYGRHQACCAQSAVQGKAGLQPEKPQKPRRMEPRPFRRRHPGPG